MSTRVDVHRHTTAPVIGQQHVFFVLSDLLGRKWHAPIIYTLSGEQMGFNELKREIDGISGKMLVENLDILTEEYRLVERTELAGRTNRVEYSLSESGETLVPVLLAFHDWATEHFENHE